jgi:uncharacterized membrane protein
MKNKPYSTEKSGPETIISYILIVGVLLSLLLEVAGIILYYREQGNLLVSAGDTVFIQGKNFFEFVWRLIQGGLNPDAGILLMITGLVILILTPFVRLIMSVIYFGWAKNLRYVWITLFVLVVITVSLIFH